MTENKKVCVCVCLCVRLCVRLCEYVCTCACFFVSACLYLCACACVHCCFCVSVCVHVFICVPFVYVHVCWCPVFVLLASVLCLLLRYSKSISKCFASLNTLRDVPPKSESKSGGTMERANVWCKTKKRKKL